MRHYLWYDTNNQIQGEMLFEGGWPIGADPSDPASTHEAAVANRDHFTALPNFGGIIDYNCPCPPSDRFCDCARQQVDGCYIDGASLAVKEAINFVIDGNSVSHNNNRDAPHLLAADAAFTLRLSGSLPDDTQITLDNCAGGVELLSTPQVLTFAGGATNTLNLTVPSAGQTGGVFAVATKLYPSLRAVVKGT